MSAGDSITDPLFLRMDVPPVALLESISKQPNIIVSANTHTACLEVIVQPQESLIMDNPLLWLPAAGLKVDPDQLYAIYAHQAYGPSEPKCGGGCLELEFEGLDHRLDLHVDKRFYEAMVECFDVREVPIRNLLKARYCSCPKMCAECRKASMRRSSNPEHYPLTRILSNAMELVDELNLRVDTPSFALDANLTPELVRCVDGCIHASADGGNELKINLSMVHCLRLKPVTLDAEMRACVTAYDPLGRQVLTMTSAHPDAYQQWLGYCEDYFGAQIQSQGIPSCSYQEDMDED